MTELVALRAIVARLEGDFDNPALEACGPLSTDRIADVLTYAKAALDASDEYHDAKVAANARKPYADAILKLTNAAREVIDSADDAGCSDDLTVASKSAIDRLALLVTGSSTAPIQRDRLLATLRNMQTFGGGFVFALAEAWFQADEHNSAKLASVFGNLLADYAPEKWERP